MREERTSSQQSRLYISLSSFFKWAGNDVQETTTGAAFELDAAAEEASAVELGLSEDAAAEEEGEEEDRQESSPPPTFMFWT